MPLNFSLGYGLVFCAGAFPLRLPWWAVFGTLVGTDIGLNVLYYNEPPLADYHLVNYLGFGVLYLLGRLFSRRASVLKHIAGSLLGAILFYLITNTGAWLENPAYSKSIAEWFRALTTGTNGWPETWTFFRNTLLSSGLFAGLISAALEGAVMASGGPVDLGAKGLERLFGAVVGAFGRALVSELEAPRPVSTETSRARRLRGLEAALAAPMP